MAEIKADLPEIFIMNPVIIISPPAQTYFLVIFTFFVGARCMFLRCN
jgi:hypothetical protein